MRGHTHALFGVTTLTLVYTYTGLFEPTAASLALCAGTGAVGALVPDLDARHSTLKRELGVAGSLASTGLRLAGIKHRGLTHYGLTAGAVLLLAWLLARWLGHPELGLAFGLGYTSHIVADGLTYRGVPLLWPVRSRFYLLPRRLRVRTGGRVEELLFVGIILLLAWLATEIAPWLVCSSLST